MILPESDTSAEARRAALYALLGALPPRDRVITAVQQDERPHDGYVLEAWTLDLNGFEPVPAYVARPRTLSGPAPAVLYNHSHGGAYDIGRREFIEGRDYLQPVPYARVLTDLGCIAVCIDHWTFGARRHHAELELFKAMLWQGRVLWGAMVYDSLRALDWLAARSDVDAGRLGTLGMSMGSTMAQYIAALDTRIRATVDICCLTDFHTLLATGGLAGHGIYYYVPGLLTHFTTAALNGLIVPRAHLSLAGLRDPLTPVAGLDLVDRELTARYAEAGAAQHWQLRRYDVGHQETPDGRAAVVAFLDAHLARRSPPRG